MADPKDGESFFRKVVRFVANPATDWNDINVNRVDDGQDLERSELKAMVERKRRNDFVRKREFDTLRRLRRDGLSPEQLAQLGNSSKVDDSEVRMNDSSGARADAGVKAKIDEIEQQMVGEGGISPTIQRRPPVEPPRRDRTAPSRPADYYSAPTAPVDLDRRLAAEPPPPGLTLSPSLVPATVDAISAGQRPRVGTPLPPLDLPPLGRGFGPSTGRGGRDGLGLPPLTLSPLAHAGGEPAPAEARPDMPRVDLALGGAGDGGMTVEVAEVMHDPELDEAVIAFANADFTHCEQALEQLRKAGGSRHDHADTWLVLFDLYRATGQQVKFEALAFDYASLFGRSAPQWFSLPKLVADAAADERPDTRGHKGEVGWVSPEVLDTDAVARLRSSTLQLPLPWVLDWGALRRIEPEAAAHLTTLLRQWAPQRLDMRWLGGSQLLATLQDAAPTGVRDADPAFWMARLEALRLSNRPDQFDEAAIDYCVTYEVSPPSWEHAECQVRSQSAGMATSPPLSIVGEPTSSFVESRLDDTFHSTPMTTVELSGQLAGDISTVLAQIDRKLGAASLVEVSCARLIRVDFIAAGDLLNWVLAKQGENRSVTFGDAHRLVALFFGAMGINEHARIQVSRL